MDNKKGIFISLKWQLLVIFGLLLVISHTAQYFVSNTQLTEQFDQQRKQNQQNQITLIKKLIEQSSRLMEQTAEAVPLLMSSKAQSTKPLKNKIEEYWSNQQANWGLSSVYQYNLDQTLNSQWGLPIENVISTQHINRASKTERPITELACSDRCFQLVYMPTLTGVSVLARSFADTLFEFSEITGNDVAILKPSVNNKKQHWGLQLDASSDPKGISNALESLSLNFSSNELHKKEIISAIGLKKLGAQLVEFNTHFSPNSPTLLLIRDLTEQTVEINNAKSNSLQVIFITMVLSIMVIFVISLNLSKRIISISTAIPALSQGAFEEVRRLLHQAQTGAIFPSKDEVDSLITSTALVTKQLENNKKQIAINSHLLQEQHNKISKDHQYMSNLLDMAPVIVISQSTDGKIIDINRLGCHVLASDDISLIGKPFKQFFTPSRNQALNLAGNREKLINTVEQETTSKNADDSIRTISWIHKNIQHESAPHTVLSIGQDITERKIIENDLIWLVDHDPLTNLYNRRYFQQQFEKQLSIAERYQETGAILFFDLDQFKYINDTSGHKAGDELLVIITNTLRKLIRVSDTLARLGGDEFAILIPETNAEGATQLAIKILNSLKELEFNPAGYNHKVSASIGIALFPQGGLNVQDLMANADLAMYHAKESGRGCWHTFVLEDKTKEQLTKRVLWKEKIESAIQENRFVLHFQAILDIKSNQISHAEALVRMIGPCDEIIMPNDFIPLAEQTGLINQIDMTVLKLAFDKLSQLHADNNPMKLSVNLSGMAFNNPELLSFIKRELERPDILAENLIFEITETTAIENFTAAQKMISEITKQGAQFALDDFGVGFSSFHHLRQLPVTYIKIDGSFIRQLGNQPEDQILVQAIADIAKTSGKKTIAEFVENEEILEKVKAFGIDYAQGYHIAKPAAEIPSEINPPTSSA